MKIKRYNMHKQKISKQFVCRVICITFAIPINEQILLQPG